MSADDRVIGYADHGIDRLLLALRELDRQGVDVFATEEKKTAEAAMSAGPPAMRESRHDRRAQQRAQKRRRP